LATILLAASFAMGQSNMVGTLHDLSSGGAGATTDTNQICVFCHTPHQSINDQVGWEWTPLWNRSLSANATYGEYRTPTFDGSVTVADIGGGATPSNLCMSCHDGTIGMGNLANFPNDLATADTLVWTAGGNVDATGNFVAGTAANLGTDLSNDHPINFTYDTALSTADGGLADPSVAPVSGWLYVDGTMQCTSCHDPHDDTQGQFLHETMDASLLCATCHTDK